MFAVSGVTLGLSFGDTTKNRYTAHADWALIATARIHRTGLLHHVFRFRVHNIRDKLFFTFCSARNIFFNHFFFTPA